jgi:hypothetical protein
MRLFVVRQRTLQWTKKLAPAAALLVLLGIGARAEGQASFESQTTTLHDAISAIQDKIREVDALKTQAIREGQAVRASCIEDKLRKIKVALHSAMVVQEGWSVARDNPAFAGRSMDRILLLKLYSVAHADDAYSCADAKGAQATVLKIDVPPPEGGATPLDPVTPPTIERPPLASPY